MLGIASLVLVTAGTARSATPRDHLLVGLKSFQDGFYDLAAKEFRAFLETAPEDPRRQEVLALLAQAEIQREAWPGAREALALLVGGASEQAREARYRLGWVLSREGKPKEALAQLDAYLTERAAENRLDALYLAAALAEKLGEPKRAGDRYATFLAEAGGDSRRTVAWLGLVRARGATGTEDRALKAAENALEDPVVRGDPGALRDVALAGVEVARRAGRAGAEADLWGTLAAGLPPGELRSRALYEVGDARLRAGEAEGARALLEKYLAADPRGAYAPRAHLLLADLARRRGDRAAEYTHIDAALARSEDPAVAKQTLELRRAAFRLALALGRQGRAVEEGRALLDREGELPPEERGMVRTTLANAAAQAGDGPGAVAHWDAVPDGTREVRKARVLAAQTLVELGRPSEALSRLRPLLGGGKSDPEVRLTALAAAEAAGEYPLAADLAAQLAANPPRGRAGAEFLHQEALLREQGGDRKGYVAALVNLVTRFPEDPRSPWFAAELQRLAFETRDWEGVLRWAPVAKGGSEGEASAYREAEALTHLGRPEDARSALRALAEGGGPYRGRALARLGVLLDEGGEREEAARRYREALAAGLDLETLGWVRQRLEALEGPPGGE